MPGTEQTTFSFKRLSSHVYRFSVKYAALSRCCTAKGNRNQISRPDLLVIDFQAVIEECISNTLTVDRAVVWTKQFASHLLSHIAPEQILLLHVFRPQYYVIKNRIRVKASNPYLQYIQTIEQAFLDQVDCHIISLDNCYFFI